MGAVDYAQKNLLIDKEQIILVGQSAGGFSSLFASGYMHSGIKAVINFAGGRGAKGNNVVCSEQNLLDAYSFAGSTSRVPSLWIYNENDQAFSPALAQAMYKAFTSFGGQGEFFLLAPFGKDGHRLFGDILGIPIWQPLVKQFFQKIKTCPLCQ